jgi:hypothetical protein
MGWVVEVSVVVDMTVPCWVVVGWVVVGWVVVWMEAVGYR